MSQLSALRVYGSASTKPTISEFYAEAGRAARLGQPLSQGTIQQDEAAIAAFWRLCGDLPVAEITAEHLQEFVRRRSAEPKGRGPEGQVSPNTIRKDLVQLRAVLIVAVRLKYRGSLPEFPRVRESDPRVIDAWRLDEVALLMSAAADNDAIRALVRFLYNTGLRIAEAMQATWDLVDREEPGWLFLPRRIMKGGRHDHRIPLNRWAKQAIEAVRRPSHPRLFSKWVWPGGKTGLYHQFGRVVRKSRLPAHRWFKFHGLRGAVYNELAGIDPLVADLLLGHRTTVGQRHYADRKRMASALALLPQPDQVHQRTLFG
jgi:integrase